MEAIKHTIKITINVLSMNSAPALLREVVEKLLEETGAGQIIKLDGDEVVWTTKLENVEF